MSSRGKTVLFIGQNQRKRGHFTGEAFGILLADTGGCKGDNP
jgi:hypothetical protein